MKFKTDENLPTEAAATLREYGFDAQTVRYESLSGATDEVVSAKARAESRVLLTLDMDFANIRAYPPENHAGIVVLRLNTQQGDRGRVCAPARGISQPAKSRRRVVDCGTGSDTLSAKQVISRLYSRG